MFDKINNKYLKLFLIIISITFFLVLLLVFFSFLSYSSKKNYLKTTPVVDVDKEIPVVDVDKEIPVVDVDKEIIVEKQFSEEELLRMSNPGKSDAELKDIKIINDNLPAHNLTDDELKSMFK